MGEVSASAVVPGRAEEAERLWFDTARWPSFVDGFRAVVRLDDQWPASGAVIWDSTPHGPGRTRERVSAPGVVEVDNEKLTGTQSVTFDDEGEDAVRVTVRLRYALRERHALTPVVDRLFVRRALRDSLTRTLRRYAAERRGDAAGH